ncbi:MAG: LysM peptidoglycan-binding domain-containing protein [Planctomycetaceae bacterium]
MVRFVLGTSLVAMGVTLAVPAGTLAYEAWRASRTGASVAVPPLPAAMPPQAPSAAAAIAPPVALSPAPWLVPEDALPPPVMPRADYAPPAAPERIPPVGAAVVADVPGINGTYRSTLQVPPPPLLDAQSAPPPAAAWTMPAAAPPPAAVAGDAPSTYAVRDGDDLASIAARFYGNPSAAVAVWDANRDIIGNPDLLPIGAEIRLPPPWTVPGLASSAVAAGQAIEPPHTAVAPRHADVQPVSSHWLTDRQAPTPPPQVGRAATVRLAPGETLETLAERFYGDRRAAARIWEANRDRLRSPELAVPGMELRLP